MSTGQDIPQVAIGQGPCATGRRAEMIPPDPASLLLPGIFAHGRLLRRYKGSEASRFSARAALNILRHVDTGERSGPHILWDPFCGTGMIPCVALFALPRKFDVVIASDISQQAVRCALGNMRLFLDRQTFEDRLREVRGLRGANPKEHRRWGEVAGYMEAIRGALTWRKDRLPSIHAFACSAFALPAGVGGEVHFVSDLPYGDTCRLQGGRIEEVIPAILRVYPRSTIRFVVRREMVEDICVDGLRPVGSRPFKNGRFILHA